MRPCATKFGLWLREQRLARNFTQRELSLESGCTRVDLNRWERGVIHPDEWSVRRLCTVFNTEFTAIWKLREESFDYKQNMGVEGMHRIAASQPMDRVRDAHATPATLMSVIPNARHNQASIEYKIRIRLDVLKYVMEEAEKHGVSAPQMAAIGIQNYFVEMKKNGEYAKVEDLVQEERQRISLIKRKAGRLGMQTMRKNRERRQALGKVVENAG